MRKTKGNNWEHQDKTKIYLHEKQKLRRTTATKPSGMLKYRLYTRNIVGKTEIDGAFHQVQKTTKMQLN